MQLSKVKVSDIRAYARNPRKHPPRQVELLAKSIKEFGFTVPVLLDREGTLIAGHGRLEAARSLGMDNIPAVRLDDLSEAQVKKLRLLDNKLAQLAEDDMENLRAELKDLADSELSALFGLDADLVPIETSEQSQAKAKLSEKFIVPPFSILDSRQGYWLERKRYWKALIVDDGKSREEVLFKSGETAMAKAIAEIGTVSIFDPVLAEVLVKWFCPKGGSVFDTFAGGASGFVYSYLGHPFLGVELRKEQADINNERLKRNKLFGELNRYVCDDGQNISKHVKPLSQDFFFSCPPYFDLEEYSDDPRDASNQTYDGFLKIIDTAFTGAAKALKDNRFAAVVMSNVRKKDGTYHDICGDIRSIMERNGLALFNELILVNSVGSAPLRAGNSMKGKKPVRMHQNVMVFRKAAGEKFEAKEEGFEFLEHLQAVPLHEDVMIFYKGDTRAIKENFK